MRLVAIDDVRPGMTLGRPIRHGERLLLHAGAPLTAFAIRRLAHLGIRSVYVQEPAAAPGQTRIPSAVGPLERTRRQAEWVVRTYMGRIRRGFAGPPARLGAVVYALVEAVLANPGATAELARIRSMDDYVFGHSVGVCALSVLLGAQLGLGRDELLPLATGALLHDLGKVRIPNPLWHKAAHLSPEELDVVRQHPTFGYELLSAQPGIDARAAHVAWEHHERWDGTGYPRGLRAGQIQRYARIVTVADVFDAMTTHRPYRRALPARDVIQFIAEQAGRMFDPRVVRAFLARAAPYPVGTRVLLNTGETATVIRLNPSLPARPVVRLSNGAGGGGPSASEVDLSVRLSRRIVGPAL